MSYVRLVDLDQWIKTELRDTDSVLVHGGFRTPKANSWRTVEICELDGTNADTIRILLPSNAPVQSGIIDTASFSSGGRKWWDTWATIFAASSIIPPIIDHVRLLDLLNEKRRIRFCCDTNALCNGVVAWLLFVLDARADVFTSAVVDRELSAWPDRLKNFWKAPTPNLWQRRTHFRIARRLIETPPDGVVVDRLSPDQPALMLTKLRDEAGYKSPDADILLIELARGLVRDQPKNARVIYLTGDKNNARAATGALGSKNVLYAVADGERVRQIINSGEVFARGWWHPSGPLGSLFTPNLSSFLWDLLAACDFLELETSSGRWRISSYNSFKTGVPSDWEEPWLNITVLHPPSASISPGTSEQTLPVELETLEEVSGSNQTPNHAEDASLADQLNEVNASQANIWLLHPQNILSGISAPASRRPTPKNIFSQLWRAYNRTYTISEELNSELDVEAGKILLSLGAISEQGGPGERSIEFKSAWERNDLDWFHGEFLRLPGYKNVIDQLRADGHLKLPKRAAVSFMMARSLGQVAQLSVTESNYIVGDAPLMVADFQAALDYWLPRAGDTLTTNELCMLASKELFLTPYRFEKALQTYWRIIPNAPFEGRTGGTVEPGPTENIVVLEEAGFHFQPVSPGTLTFGRDGPVRFIARIEL